MKCHFCQNNGKIIYVGTCIQIARILERMMIKLYFFFVHSTNCGRLVVNYSFKLERTFHFWQKEAHCVLNFLLSALFPGTFLNMCTKLQKHFSSCAKQFLLSCRMVLHKNTFYKVKMTLSHKISAHPWILIYL